MRYDKFGMSSNGLDAVWIMQKEGRFVLNYTLNEENERLFSLLKKYAGSKGYRTEVVEYQAMRGYDQALPQPSISVMTNYGDKFYEMVQDIMTNVFGNNEKTMYSVAIIEPGNDLYKTP